MPILHAEISLHPADLLDRPQSADASWWAMYTLSQREKQLMRSLHSRGVEFYCPIVEHRYRAAAGRLRVSYLPLFSNYVFVHGREESRHAALATGCVSRDLPIPDVRCFLRQMRDMQTLIESGRPMSVESLAQPGEPVRIKSGPMTGLMGVLLKRRSPRRFLVAVDFLQQGASIELEDWEFERI